MFEWIHCFLMQHPILSPFLYLMFHILCAVLIIPCSPMAVIAGALWGQWLGLVLSIIAAFLSSCVTFGLARYFLKAPLYRFVSRRYAKTDWFLEQTQKHGWKFVASVQLNPAAPGSTLGYLFGLTNIAFRVYAKYLILFMLPLQLALVWLGSSAVKLYWGKWSWWLLGFIAVMLIWTLVQKKLKRVLSYE